MLDLSQRDGVHGAGVPDDGGRDEHEVREAVVDARWHGQRVDRVLVDLAPEFSRSHLQRLIEDGLVRLDGAPARAPSRRVSAGQRLHLTLRQTEQALAFRAERMPLQIVFEDDDLLVVNKPIGVVVHPAVGHWSGTLLNGLLAHYAGAATLPRAGIVHRLDKDTSGLMVVGKTVEAVTALVRRIAARDVSRTYLAIAHGHPPDGAAVDIEAPVGRDPRSRLRMAVVPTGRAARTRVRLLARGEGVSLLRCDLHTGRTHQIRVHLAHQGHPLVGDMLYGGRPALGMARQALHAGWLGFAHPRDGRALAFSTPVPTDMALACAGSGIDLDAALARLEAM